MKKVIIIGATSGIGRALAKEYVNAGHRVGITGRREELLQSFRREFEIPDGPTGSSKNFIATECFDVTGKDNILHLQSLIDKLGGMDLFIYNSGFGDPSTTLDWAIDKKTVDINVNGFIEMTNWSFHYFLNQDSGHIVATSSIASNRGNSFAPAYSASKAFISCYLEGLYLKARKMGSPIFITDIQPGFVKTKEINIKGQFWVVPVEKAASQMMHAIEKNRFRVYISKRWWLIAKLMRMAPRFIYRLVG